MFNVERLFQIQTQSGDPRLVTNQMVLTTKAIIRVTLSQLQEAAGRGGEGRGRGPGHQIVSAG